MSDHAPTAIDFNALTWFKSSASGENGACVEVARTHGGWVALRDSKDPTGPKHLFTNTAWAAFIRAIRDGEFNTSQ